MKKKNMDRPVHKQGRECPSIKGGINMGQACQVCNHPKRVEIDRELIQGKSVASLARRCGVSEAALYNHRDNHITRQLATAMAQKKLHQSMDLIGDIDELLRRTKRIMNKAEEKDNLTLELRAIAEARSSYELLSKIALTLHQIRVLELEQERQQQKQENTVDLSILNDRELAMFERLVRKINKGDPSIEVLRDKPRKHALESIENPPLYKSIPSHFYHRSS